LKDKQYLTNSAPYFKTNPFDITQEVTKTILKSPDGQLATVAGDPQTFTIPFGNQFGILDDEYDQVTA